MSDGAGAGNLWTKGLQHGEMINDEISDILDSELENADSAEVCI